MKKATAKKKVTRKSKPAARKAAKKIQKKSPKKSTKKSVASKPVKKKSPFSNKAAAKKKTSIRHEGELVVFKPNPEKLALVRQTFVTVLWKHEALPPEKVREMVMQEVAHKLADEFHEYFSHVNDLLVKFRLIEPVPDKSPLHIRLAQRLEE